jgi:pimeloyl-ACP methyl ester carboxylesterase
MSDQSSQVPPHFVVIVPGYLGSKLRDKRTGEIVWIDFSSIPRNPLRWDDWVDNLFEKMAYLNDDLEPAGIMDELIFVPPWAKQEHYGRLIEALEEMGYVEDQNLYSFPYDWRQDNRLSAQQLGEAIDKWRADHPGAKAWIIAHSNGGIVARWYIEQEGGKDHVDRLFLMGSPWDGTPKAMCIMFTGFETLFRKRFDLFNITQRSRELFRTFPSIYQLLPSHDPFLRDLNNEAVNPFTNLGWINTDEEKALLKDGQQLNQDLGTSLSVDTICFFGRKTPTTIYGIVRSAAGGRWDDIEWAATEAGDGTIPERSAVHPKAKQKLPFAVGHGDIHVTPAVLEMLEWELVDKYQQPERAVLITERLVIVFEPEKDTYSPGETIKAWATIHDADRKPISGARVETRLLWRQALPGETQVTSPQALPKTRLWEEDGAPGRYKSDDEDFVAPEIEGYYSLQTTVQALGEPAVMLEELILVETMSE